MTGGTQGIGAAIALRLAQAGCHLVLHGLKHDTVADQTLQACRQHQVQAHCVAGDLSQPAPGVAAMLLQQLDELHSAPTILINNAGTCRDVSFLDMDWQTYRYTQALNVEAGYFLTQAMARRWIAQGTAGRVLFTGSINGQLAETSHTAYDISKGAVQMMVRTLCVALAGHRIRVNAMAPGLIMTPLTATALQGNALGWMQLHTPNGQVPGPEVCAGAALFLVSDEAEHIHGQTLLVDGGMSAWQQPDPPANWTTSR
ncbi:MAG: SDR family oxidoreductase [Pirellulaceae bacterium]|nr:SDR family oxidoreductase [Pirellulaceae bacterium]